MAQGMARRGDAVQEIELGSMAGNKDEEEPELLVLAAPATRNGFVRKVYGILTVQLLVTLFMAGLFVQNGRHWLKAYPAATLGVMLLSSIASLGVACSITCCPQVLREYPKNYFILSIFTVAESMLVGFCCVRYTAGSVLLCIGLTAFIVSCLTVYAMRTEADFTGFGPYIFTALLIFCGAGFMMGMVQAMGLSHNPLFNGIQVMYAIGGAIIFSFFIVHDTQLIVGGCHKHQFSVDDYCMAAISLYLDVINLFLQLLELLGRDDKSI